MRALPTDDDARVNLNGQRDNHAHLASPPLVARKAASRFATTAAMAIASSFRNRLLMPIQGDQNWRRRGEQDDAKIWFLRGTGLKCKTSRLVPLLFMRAPSRRRRASRYNTRRRARAGFRRAILGQITGGTYRSSRSVKMARRNIDLRRVERRLHRRNRQSLPCVPASVAAAVAP